MRLNDAELVDSGEYTVTAQNSVGKASDSATVYVRSKLSISHYLTMLDLFKRMVIFVHVSISN